MTPNCHVSKSRMLKKVTENNCLLVTGTPIFYEGKEIISVRPFMPWASRTIAFW